MYLEMGGRVEDVTLVLALEGPDEVDTYFEERFRGSTCLTQNASTRGRDRLLRDHRGGLRPGSTSSNAVAQGVVADLLTRRGHPARP